MRTRQKCVATDTWRSLGCRTTPLEHWSRRKPTVEPRWAKQQTKKLRPKPTKINSFMSGPSLSLTPDPPAGSRNVSEKISTAGDITVFFFFFFFFFFCNRQGWLYAFVNLMYARIGCVLKFEDEVTCRNPVVTCSFLELNLSICLPIKVHQQILCINGYAL